MTQHDLIDAVVVEATDIEPVQPHSALAPSDLFVGDPTVPIKAMEKVVTYMAKKCTGERFISPITGKNYPKVEWWTTMGGIIGVFPQVESVEKIELEDGNFKFQAWVKTVDRNGRLVTRARSSCSTLERLWSDRDEYAIESMSQTRAIGAAFRKGFSFLAAMAGLEPTPAEEMMGVRSAPAPKAPAKKKVAKKKATKKAAAPPATDEQVGEKADTDAGEGTIQAVITKVEEYKSGGSGAKAWTIWNIWTDQNDFFSTFSGQGEYDQADLAINDFGGRAEIDWWIDPAYPTTKKVRDGGVRAGWKMDDEKEEADDESVFEEMPL